MPDGTGGKDVTNGVKVKKGEKEYHAEGTVQNAVREKKLLKNSSGTLETVSAGKMQEKSGILQSARRHRWARRVRSR